jgi:hypothetical protein
MVPLPVYVPRISGSWRGPAMKPAAVPAGDPSVVSDCKRQIAELQAKIAEFEGRTRALPLLGGGGPDHKSAVAPAPTSLAAALDDPSRNAFVPPPAKQALPRPHVDMKLQRDLKPTSGEGVDTAKLYALSWHPDSHRVMTVDQSNKLMACTHSHSAQRWRAADLLGRVRVLCVCACV